MQLRNIAIIAHVDHGKTTLVDKIIHQVKLFRDNQEFNDLILDNNDLERERGITILSKNVSVRYKDTKINVIDTPGHSDFGGEVERVLNMADGVVLLVDAFEGPMPQTRFVLQKALELGKKVICVVNKVDKDNCDPEAANEAVFELMFSLDATEEQLEYPVVYGSSKNGWMGPDWKTPTEDITYLLDKVLEVFPAPAENPGTTQMQISSLDFSSFTGRIAIGRVNRGTVQAGQRVSVMHRDDTISKATIKELFTFEGMGREKTDTAIDAGELVAITGLEKFDIGDTIADIENPEAMAGIPIDEPSMSMLFTINNSPFFGKEGKHVTSQKIRERLDKELEKNLALRVEDTDSPDKFIVYGRGILHLSVLIETMRREGYELQLGQPQVVVKVIDGVKCEPIEELSVNVPEHLSGKVIEIASQRKGDMTNMEHKADRVQLTFHIPARGLIGFTNPVLTATEGEAIISHRFHSYEPMKGEIGGKKNGALISMEQGAAIAYSLNKLQDRGKFFVDPNDEIYTGQVIGENNRADDMVINLTKSKKLSNVRSAGADDKINIAPAIKFSLEEAMEYVGEDEYVEVTPTNIRLRKIILEENERKRARTAAKHE